ncbi:helix-turn-helix domain-containing protein [Crateriforma conspicua]|uniref:Helix-turn-helix domain protein n=1 Tax=Crateriforma conspicua TaxID=2527996 RepID=A0A5C5Y3C0_9PLAN|nr:helix-turn-helix domain-containing protein [Crateriforma conspicua]TWT69720.1 Helix-turn-helix domain protein [Crateriforma conspicua]
MAITVPSSDGDNLICLSRDDASKRLGISSRTLYERTAPRGPIFAVRFGRRVLYPVAEIDRYIAEQIASQSDEKNGGAK